MTRRYTSKMLDFSGGVVGGVSDYGRKGRHLKACDNMLLRPYGALQVRLGSQRACSATLSEMPHSLGQWVDSAGIASPVARVFVGAKSATAGRIYYMTGSSFTLQTVPYTLPTSKMCFEQLNSAIFCTNESGSNPPIFWRNDNPANTWHKAALPRPSFMATPSGSSVTLISSVPSGVVISAGTVTAGPSLVDGATQVLVTPLPSGGVSALCTLSIGGTIVPNCWVVSGSPTIKYGSSTAKVMTLALNGTSGGMVSGATYYYRLRYRYKDGSSMSSAVSSITLGANDHSIAITDIRNEIRSDYLGWTLERTKYGGTADGPWYELDDSTSTTQSSYTDTNADADLGARTDPELIHNEPLHYDGVIAHRDRLFGWSGSTLYCSQSIGDAESTGICNWNPLNGYEFGKDDGDKITCVVRQNDRLLVFKRWSVWALDGYDPTNFVVVPVYQGAGASGSRAAASMGGTVWFYGDAGMHVVNGYSARPFGWQEVGDKFDLVVKSEVSEVVVKNYLGQLLLVSYSTSAGMNDSMLVYDQRFGGWTSFSGWRASDILIQRSATFGDLQSILFVDKKDFDSTPSSDYRVWIGFYGYKDEKNADGTGGNAVKVYLETPDVDDGSVDTDKDYERVQVHANASVTTSLSVEVSTRSPFSTRSFSATVSQDQTIWGAATWGSFRWAASRDQSPTAGLASGLIGSTYKLKMTAYCSQEYQFKGYTVDVIVLPSRRFS